MTKQNMIKLEQGQQQKVQQKQKQPQPKPKPKIKKLTKPKKPYEKCNIYKPQKFFQYNYSRQSAQQRARLRKAQDEQMYLIDSIRYEDKWQFKVESATKQIYNVIISSKKCQCQCLDYQKTYLNPCKHIFFIILRIGQQDLILPYIKSEGCMEELIYQILDGLFLQNIDSFQKNKPIKKQRIIEQDDKCAICLQCLVKVQNQRQSQQQQNNKQQPPEQQNKTNLSLWKCSKCSNSIHSVCMEGWIKQIRKCPYCKANLQQYSPLQKLNKFQDKYQQ